MRRAKVMRKTGETEIEIELALDGSGERDVSTGIGFLDHLLDQLALHGLLDLALRARGDLEVDPHHTVEDVALVLGQALDEALGDRRGVARVGSAFVPMDDALAHVVVDLCGRPHCVFEASFRAPLIGALPAALVRHFFCSLAVGARSTIHSRVHYGLDDHHQAEALFKALGRALEQATAIVPRRKDSVPSSKGVL